MIKRSFISLVAILCCVCAVVTLSSCNDNKEDNSNMFTVKYGETQITLGGDAGDVLAALGEPTSTKPLGDCGGLGTQVEYTYKDIVLYTLKNSKGEIIDEIELRNDLVSTEKGISIGASENEVIKAYGEATQKESKYIRYTEKYNSEYRSLIFTLENGEISSIAYVRTFQNPDEN